MEAGWLGALAEEFEKPYMQKLREFLLLEAQRGAVIYPPKELVFNAFWETSFAQTCVVIMGQDPYHGRGQSHGLSFSVPQGAAIPPSLKNVYKELQSDVGIAPPSSGCLLPWAKQGVLLLNATLTVRAGEPKSHYGQGWELFTDRVVEVLAARPDPLVFMLWGRSAKEKCQKALFGNVRHLVLEAAHPSFYSAAGFFGAKHFSKANAFLQSGGRAPICWQID